MYYYYYYNSFVQLNFRFLEENSNPTNKGDQISMIEIENLISCINELNKCAIENTIGKRKYNKKEHSLKLKKITYNSPLDLSVIVPLTASIIGIPYLIVKIVEKINDVRIETEKHKNEVEKHKYEIKKQKLEIEKLKIDMKEKSKNRVQIPDENLDLIYSKIISSKRYMKVLKSWKKLPFKIVKYDVQFGVADEG